MDASQYIQDLQAIHPVNEADTSLLLRHLQMVETVNSQFNLTRITDPVQALYLHIFDSLSAVTWLQQPEVACFADIGSGAGYPGIPLSIVSKKAAVLIESVQKKAQFLKDCVTGLGLDQKISIEAVRAEEVARRAPGMFQAVTARAVAPLAALAELASPLLSMQGILIAYKGSEVNQEIEQLVKLEAKLGMYIEENKEYLIPKVGIRHRLIIIRKTAEAEIPLPRRDGLAQKKALK